ncbi:MAG: nucleoside-diphosphate sugar epimerase/dehydratase [Melioribacteraceae bacterium]|nr:nucleoside-diphosphate sugar epimerase/dehydratase [Melioribacteraceae bacterium]
MDSFIVFFSMFAGYLILHPYFNVLTEKVLILSVITIFSAHHFFAWRYGLYRKVWSYASVGELTSIVRAVTYSIISVMVMQVVVNQDIYVRVLIITWMLHILLIGGSRFSWRLAVDLKNRKLNLQTKRTLIVGAGAAGTMVVRQLLINQERQLQPVGFVDDNLFKQNLEIYGVEVLGKIKNIPEIVARNQIESIIIAIPSLSKQEMIDLTKICVGTGVKTQTIPRIEDLMTGKVSVNEIRDVRLEDLLGREEVKLDMVAIANQLTNKKILITGAGGSIGSEICRQVARFEPKEIILLGHGENSIYKIDLEMRSANSSTTKVIPIIADIQDRNRIFEIMEKYKPDVVYHAAAHKHVPLMELNPREAVKNNIYGTFNVAEAAKEHGVSCFVMISTDKAVNPPNIMGATKRFAEMIIQNLAVNSKTKFAAVRFGNVLGSNGSVVPLFISQIAKGGPVTVTDPEMTRYFMTIPEASRLVIQAGTLAAEGEIFVLDMGEPVKIVNLAKNLIRLSGYEEDEIGIEFSGIRPGEKLFEELLNEDEIQSDHVFPKIYIGKSTPINNIEMNNLLDKMLGLNNEELKDMLIRIANKQSIRIVIQ